MSWSDVSTALAPRVARSGFSPYALGEEFVLWVGALPAGEAPTAAEWEDLWESHPQEYHTIMMHGREVKTPRWQQAYGADYFYTGRVNEALPLTPLLRRLLDWTRAAIDPRLNGVLVNWYDAEQRHYIGPHRDSIESMIAGAPIVTISLGAARVFRLRRWRQKDIPPFDFTAADGTVFVMPYETNRAFTHEVPHFARNHGRRISITMRAFEQGVHEPAESPPPAAAHEPLSEPLCLHPVSLRPIFSPSLLGRLSINLDLRPAAKDDIPLLAHMNRQLADDEGSRNPMSIEELGARMEQWLTDGWQAVLFEEQSQPIGYALFRVGRDDYDPDIPEVHLRQFFIIREARGKGLGRRAFALLTTTAFPAGAQISLDVLATNPQGQRFWESLGFQLYASNLRRWGES